MPDETNGKDDGKMSGIVSKVIQGVLVVLVVSGLTYVWSQVRTVRTHVEEVPTIKQWIGYADPTPAAPSAVERIAILETSLSSSLSDFRRKSFVFNDSHFQLETVNTVI